MTSQHLLAPLIGVVAVGVGAQWLAWRLKWPAIVLLALIGLAVGPLAQVLAGTDLLSGWFETQGFLPFRPQETLGPLFGPVVSLSVAIILFEGGLTLSLSEFRLAAVGVRRLVWLGAPLTWLFCSAAGYFIGGLGWQVSLVFGAILVVTGPTVILPMLRQAGLNRRTASYLKWEGIVNDPIGALLAVLVYQFLVYAQEGSGWARLLEDVGMAAASGALLGGVGGWLAGNAFRRGWVPEYLKSPVLFSLVLIVFGVADAMQAEAGLLAVTIMGMVIGNMNLPGIEDMKRFKEYISVMLISVVFVLLTANLDTRVLGALDWHAGLLVVAILFVTRPLAIMMATARSGMGLNDRILLSWIAPRGIVAAATAGLMGQRLQEAGYESAEKLLPLIFAVIIASVILHGSTIGPLARRLGLASKTRDSVLIVGASPWTIELAKTLDFLNVKVLIADASWSNLREARLAGLQVFHGEVLSEFAEESLEIAHVQAVLAATSNDAYNALVCTTMAPEVGQSRVFQLPGQLGHEDDSRGVARERRGNIAFDAEAVFERLWRWHVRGWKFYKTRLTETYGYSDFLGDCPAEALQILVLNEEGAVKFRTASHESEPSEGDTIVYYGPERPVREERSDKKVTA